MWKEHKGTLIVASVVTLLPILIGVILWDRLPDTMAIHFGANNAANGFAGKTFAVITHKLISKDDKKLLIEWRDEMIKKKHSAMKQPQ